MTVPKLPPNLRQDLVLTEKSLLTPLEERIRQRMKRLEDAAKELRE